MKNFDFETVFEHYGIAVPELPDGGRFRNFDETPCYGFEIGRLREDIAELFWKSAGKVCRAGGASVDDVFPEGPESRLNGSELTVWDYICGLARAVGPSCTMKELSGTLGNLLWKSFFCWRAESRNKS